MQAFESWTYEEVEDTFGIEFRPSSPFFENWLKAENTRATPAIQQQLEELRQELFEEVDNWNEDELKLFFIGPLINLVHFKTPNFKPFTQRTLSVMQNDVLEASGKIDFLLARGKLTPKMPFFCLHEYKQENRRDNDPLGQLLIAMVAAQIENKDEKPLYGCYVSGRNWFFVVLDDKKYAVSSAYDATDEVKIAQILAILFYFKELSNIYFKDVKL